MCWKFYGVYTISFFLKHVMFDCGYQIASSANGCKCSIRDHAKTVDSWWKMIVVIYVNSTVYYPPCKLNQRNSMKSLVSRNLAAILFWVVVWRSLEADQDWPICLYPEPIINRNSKTWFDMQSNSSTALDSSPVTSSVTSATQDSLNKSSAAPLNLNNSEGSGSSLTIERPLAEVISEKFLPFDSAMYIVSPFDAEVARDLEVHEGMRAHIFALCFPPGVWISSTSWHVVFHSARW